MIVVFLCTIALGFSFVLYTKNGEENELWFPIAICSLLFLLVFTVVVGGYLCNLHIKTLMNNYKNKGDLISGAFILIFVFAFFEILISFVYLLKVSDAFRETMQMLVSFLTAVMAALIGLLGVRYSIAVQERNRKEDLRLGAKPYFAISCCQEEMIPDEDGNAIHKVKVRIIIKNISNNIGIPYRIRSLADEKCIISLPYNPLANNSEYNNVIELTSVENYGPNTSIAIDYKDVYGNNYTATVSFILHKTFKLSNTTVISDELVDTLN